MHSDTGVIAHTQYPKVTDNYWAVKGWRGAHRACASWR
jgi:hypothetical protein